MEVAQGGKTIGFCDGAVDNQGGAVGRSDAGGGNLKTTGGSICVGVVDNQRTAAGRSAARGGKLRATGGG